MSSENNKMYITEWRDMGNDTDGKPLVYAKIIFAGDSQYELPHKPGDCYNLKGQTACGDNWKFMNGSCLFNLAGNMFVYLDGWWRSTAWLPEVLIGGDFELIKEE